MLVAATACWGVGTVVTKQVLDDVAPLTLLPVQLTASCLLLAGVSLLTRTRRDGSGGHPRRADSPPSASSTPASHTLSASSA